MTEYEEFIEKCEQAGPEKIRQNYAQRIYSAKRMNWARVWLDQKAQEKSDSESQALKKISSDSNDIARESNLLAAEANEISNKANEIAERALKEASRANLYAEAASRKARQANIIALIAVIVSLALGLTDVLGVVLP